MIRRITLFALPLVISGTLAHADLGPKKPSELVNAVAFRGFSDTCCSSSETAFDLTFNADGKRTSFAIPAGKVFVVTGIEWNSFSGTPNRQTGAAVILETPGSCDALFINSTAIADGAGNAGNNLVIPNGVRVRAGQRLCMFMSGGTLNSARAFGYFARDN
jgi:hypothetical protein